MSHIKTKHGINKNHKYPFNSSRDLPCDMVTPTVYFIQKKFIIREVTADAKKRQKPFFDGSRTS